MSTFYYFTLFLDARCPPYFSLVLFQYVVGLFAHYFFWTEWFHLLNIRCRRLPYFVTNIYLILHDINNYTRPLRASSTAERARGMTLRQSLRCMKRRAMAPSTPQNDIERLIEPN